MFKPHRPSTASGLEGGDGPFSPGMPAASPPPGAAASATGLDSPRLGAAALQQALYLKEAGDTAQITVNDLHQGQLGDCFLLSSIGEIAMQSTTAISNMITVNRDGSETVRLYTVSGRLNPVTVTNVFDPRCVNNGATQDVVGNQKEIWPQVIEKAYAQAHGGYGAIANGGAITTAMTELTGKGASWQTPSSLTLQAFQGHIAAKDLIAFGTVNAGNLAYNLVGGHAYMFRAMVNTASGAAVQLLNPWGTRQPDPVPFAKLASVFNQVDYGHI